MFKRLKNEVISLFVTYIGSYLLLKDHLFLLQAARDCPQACTALSVHQRATPGYLRWFIRLGPLRPFSIIFISIIFISIIQLDPQVPDWEPVPLSGSVQQVAPVLLTPEGQQFKVNHTEAVYTR